MTTSTADSYLVSEICKKQESLLKTLEGMRTEVEAIDAQAIADMEERVTDDETDWLVLTHEKLGELDSGIAMWRLVTLIFSVMAKKNNDQNETR